MEITVLIGDYKKQNTTLKLIKIINEDIEVLDQYTYNTSDFKSLKELLTNYLTKFKSMDIYPKLGILGIPGTVIKNKVLSSYIFPDLNGISGKEVGKQIGLDNMIIQINFNFNGYAIQKDLKEGIDYIKLSPSAPNIKMHQRLY